MGVLAQFKTASWVSPASGLRLETLVLSMSSVRNSGKLAKVAMFENEFHPSETLVRLVKLTIGEQSAIWLLCRSSDFSAAKFWMPAMFVMRLAQQESRTRLVRPWVKVRLGRLFSLASRILRPARAVSGEPEAM